MCKSVTRILLPRNLSSDVFTMGRHGTFQIRDVRRGRHGIVASRLHEICEFHYSCASSTFAQGEKQVPRQVKLSDSVCAFLHLLPSSCRFLSKTSALFACQHHGRLAQTSHTPLVHSAQCQSNALLTQTPIAPARKSLRWRARMTSPTGK